MLASLLRLVLALSLLELCCKESRLFSSLLLGSVTLLQSFLNCCFSLLGSKLSNLSLGFFLDFLGLALLLLLAFTSYFCLGFLRLCLSLLYRFNNSGSNRGSKKCIKFLEFLLLLLLL